MRSTYLALGFLLVPHFLLLRLYHRLRGPQFCAQFVRRQAGPWAKGAARGVPLLAWDFEHLSACNS